MGEFFSTQTVAMAGPMPPKRKGKRALQAPIVVLVNYYKQKIPVSLHYHGGGKEQGIIVGLDEFFNLMFETRDADGSRILTLVKGNTIVMVEPHEAIKRTTV